jgi:hypothetical protein
MRYFQRTRKTYPHLHQSDSISEPTVNATSSNPKVFRRNRFIKSPNLHQYHQIHVPLPSQRFNQYITQIICNPRLNIRTLNIRQWMRKTHRRTPRHRKHNPRRYAQSFRTMNMRKTRWIGYNCICNKVVLDTGAPTSFDHFVHHFSAPADFACLKGFQGGDQGGVADHVLDVFSGEVGELRT